MNTPLPLSFYLRAACRKIGYQFPDLPEGRLMFAVVQQAVMDLHAPVVKGGGKKHQAQVEMLRASARGYLNGDMSHAQIVGVNPQWIREVLEKVAGVKL